MKKLQAHYLFSKTDLSLDDVTEINEIATQLSKIVDKEDRLKKAYEIITTRYEAGRIKTFSRLFDLWGTSLQDLWNRSGFLHCTNQNYLLASLLVRSGNFTESDIVPIWTTIWYCTPHQYLRVRLSDNQYVRVDCWARHYGIPFGKYATGFNTNLTRSFASGK